MPECPGQGNAFQHVIPRRVCLHPGAVPVADHMLGSGKIVVGQGLQLEPGVLRPEAVDVVPLFLELSTFQIG